MTAWHDTTRRKGTLTIEKKVYEFKNKKTTSTQVLDKWLEEEFGEYADEMYSKLDCVDIQTKKFREVED